MRPIQTTTEPAWHLSEYAPVSRPTRSDLVEHIRKTSSALWLLAALTGREDVGELYRDGLRLLRGEVSQ